MALDPVPWFIGGDAQHSPEVARMLAYLAANGKEGIVAPGDLKVLPLDVPGAGVKISVGGASILNRAGSQQAYTVRNPTVDVDSCKIAATGSSGGRTDLIVAVVDNPYVDSNAQAPADPVNGPYVRFRVLPGVPSGTVRAQDVPAYAGLSAITLARVTLPASTGTVTSANITDLRAMANPRQDTQNALGSTVDAQVTLATNTWQNFPANAIGGIVVPPWATHAVLMVNTTMQYISGDAVCNFQSFMGPAGQLDATTLFSDQQIDTSTTGGQYRQPLVMPSDRIFVIPPAWRGTTVQIQSRVRGLKSGGIIATRASDYLVAAVTFKEQIR